MSSKVFFITEYVNKTSNSTGFYWSRIIDFFIKNEKCEPSVFAVDIDHSHQNKEIFKRIHSKGSHGKNNISRILIQFSLLFSFFSIFFFKVKPNDVVVVGTNPIGLLLFIPILKKLKRFKLVIISYDVYPEAMHVVGLIKEKGFLSSLLQVMFSSSFKCADKIIAIGDDMKKLLMRSKGVADENVIVVQNWADEDSVREMSKEESFVYQKVGFDQDDFIFTFFGNLGRLQDIEILLEASSYIRIPEIKILFIGSGYYEKAITERLNDSKQSNIRFHSAIPSSQQSHGLAVCDVSIVSLKKGMYGIGVPSKSYFNMLANRPILAIMDEGSEIHQMVEKHLVGWWIDNESPQKLAKLMENIYDKRDKWMGLNQARKIYYDFYSEAIGVAKINNVISSLCI